VYSNVVFAPGDVVVVGAGGCVQTGGSGNTWKLYVKPSGPDADHLYHGLIRIPTATPGNGLDRINDIKDQNLTVTGAGVRQSDLVLHLGYEDDDYSDNGYYSHDDGTEDQCKSIGPAQVRVVIFRGVPPPGSGNKFDFDLAWTTPAPGGLPLNPQWSWQQRVENRGAIPDTALCHNFSQSVPVGGGRNGTRKIPSFADCTDQTDLNHVDQPDGWNDFICSFGDSNSFEGHVNWFPVTFQGKAGWGDHGADDDYTFEFRRDGNPLSVNGRSGLHTEFDTDETVDHFNTDEWNAFHQAVDQSKAAKATLAECGGICDASMRAQLQAVIDYPRTLFDGDTILTGMFGLDCEHDCKAELHPLYALATKRDNFENDPSDEVWLMFVRNMGDEGYCSSHLWSSGFTTYTFRLPWHEQMSSVEVLWGVKKSQFEGTDGTSGPTVTYLPPPQFGSGVYVTFTLPPASQSPLIDGALHLKWTGSPGAIARSASPLETGGRSATHTLALGGLLASSANAKSEDIDEAEHRILAAIAQLPTAKRQQIQKAREVTSARVSLHLLPAGRPAQKITAAPAAPRMAMRVNAKAGAASHKQQQDDAQLQALCAATNNAPAGLPAEACKPIPPIRRIVRDHR
jgi:hypothetical protein